MSEAENKLYKLQAGINSQSKNESSFEENLMFCKVGNLLKMSFFGNPQDESFTDLLKVLAEKEVAETIRSIDFNSPDEGANGTNNFDFSLLADSKTIFPELKKFSVKLTEPEEVLPNK